MVKSPKRSGTAQSRYRKESGLDSGTDADHLVDLKVNGADDLTNIWGLDSSVNRSIGSQIQHQIKGFPKGTIINRFNYAYPISTG